MFHLFIIQTKSPLNKSTILTVDLPTLIHSAPLIELKSGCIEASTIQRNRVDCTRASINRYDDHDREGHLVKIHNILLEIREPLIQLCSTGPPDSLEVPAP